MFSCQWCNIIENVSEVIGDPLENLFEDVRRVLATLEINVSGC
jgi:hypothetical protein